MCFYSQRTACAAECATASVVCDSANNSEAVRLVRGFPAGPERRTGGYKARHPPAKIAGLLLAPRHSAALERMPAGQQHENANGQTLAFNNHISIFFVFQTQMNAKSKCTKAPAALELCSVTLGTVYSLKDRLWTPEAANSEEKNPAQAVPTQQVL